MNTQTFLATLAAVLLHQFTLAIANAADPLAKWHVRLPPVTPTQEEFEGVAYGNDRWVIVGADGSILSSPDGAQWTPETNPAAPSRLDDITFGNGLFVAVGRNANVMVTSTDGRQWTKRTPGFSGSTEIIHDGTRFVTMLAGGYFSISTNGMNWFSQPKIPQKYVDVGGVAFGNGVYVTAGYKRTGTPPDFFSSPDYTDWTRIESPVSENLMNACFGLGLFVVVGQKGTLMTSPNGSDWTPRAVPHTGFIWDVASGGGQLVAAAQWGRLLTSPDGITWTRRETDLTWHLTDVAFGKDTFVAVGRDGQIVQSDPVVVALPVQVRLSDPAKAPTSGPATFRFSGEVGRSYTIESSMDLRAWTPLGVVTVTSSPMPFMHPTPPEANCFYRVVQQ